MAFAAALVLATIGVVPAAAEENGDPESTTTFVLDSDDALFVSAPGTVDLGTVAGSDDLLGGETVTGTWNGEVVVSDTRLSGTSWSASVEGTDFVRDGGDPEEAGDVIAASVVEYQPGTDPTVDGLLNLDAVTTNDGTLDTPFVTVEAALVTGSNETRWTPTLVIQLTDGQRGGTYQGTITHSVSGS